MYSTLLALWHDRGQVAGSTRMLRRGLLAGALGRAFRGGMAERPFRTTIHRGRPRGGRGFEPQEAATPNCPGGLMGAASEMGPRPRRPAAL